MPPGRCVVHLFICRQVYGGVAVAAPRSKPHTIASISISPSCHSFTFFFGVCTHLSWQPWLACQRDCSGQEQWLTEPYPSIHTSNFHFSFPFLRKSNSNVGLALHIWICGRHADGWCAETEWEIQALCTVSAHHKQQWSSMLFEICRKKQVENRVRFKLPVILWPFSEKIHCLVKSQTVT